MPQPPKRNIDLSKAATGRAPAPMGNAPAQQPSPAVRQGGAPQNAPQSAPYRAQRPMQGSLPPRGGGAQGQAGARTAYRGDAAASRGTAPQRGGAGTQRPSAPQGRTAAPTARQAAPQPRAGASTGPARNAGAQSVRGYAGAQPVSGRGNAGNRGGSGGRGGSANRSSSANRRNPAATGTRPRNARGSAKAKQQAKRRLLITLCSICAVLALCAVGLTVFLSSVLNTGAMGSLAQQIKTPPQLAKDQMSLLVVGIDKTAFDGEGVVRDGVGQTDMLLYLRFNFADNTLRMLQIPRDLFMGKAAPTGGTGKLNGLYKHGENQEKNRVNNVAVPISETLQLPIDAYVAIDMIALREIVDVFGGIEVYVAEAHAHEGSSLAAGWQTLHGDMLEFFLRDRYNTPTGDIGRLDTQRYFYSALFRRLRTATWKDIVKLTPVAQNYVDTDLSAMDTAALAIRMLKIPSSNIMMCRTPTYDSAENYNSKHAVQVLDVAGTADLLNEYFRTPEAQLAAEQYNFADWPHEEVAHKANVQWMSDVDADGGGTVGDAADAAQTGDDLLAPPAVSGSGA